MRNAVITGAARGIGRAIAEQLLKDGFNIIGSFNEGSQSATELIENYGPDRVDLTKVDLADRMQTRRFVEHAVSRGSINTLILNAGIIEFASLRETTEDQWDRVVEVNLTSAWLLAKGLSSSMAQGSSIVAISSTDAFTASYSSISYTVSKAGLIALMNCLAAVLGERGIRCVPLCAGWVDSGMSTDESYEAADLTPLKRNGTPRDIAQAVSFLVSDAASFVNGSPFVIDGGYGLIDYIVKKEAEGLEGHDSEIHSTD